MVKYFYIAFIGVVLLGCKRPDHELSFDIQKQVIVNCNNNQLNKLSIENDSINKKGFPVEKGLLIYWNGTAGVRTPKELDLSNIPSGYRVMRGANDYEGYKYIFKPNSSYLIEKFGGGQTAFYLRVWTDSLGRVYKTTHPNCGLKSLESNEEMYQG